MRIKEIIFNGIIYGRPLYVYMMQIHIIFFVYLNPEAKYLEIINGQISDMKRVGLLDVSHLGQSNIHNTLDNH